MGKRRNRARGSLQSQSKQSRVIIALVLAIGLGIGVYARVIRHDDPPRPALPKQKPAEPIKKSSKAVAPKQAEPRPVRQDAPKDSPKRTESLPEVLPAEPVAAAEPVKNEPPPAEPEDATVLPAEPQDDAPQVEPEPQALPEEETVEPPVPRNPKLKMTRSMQKWMKRSNDVYSVFEAAREGNVKVLRARLAENAPVNIKNERGDTPLHVAAEGGYVLIVKELLAAGADPMAKNKDGKIASEVAAVAAVRAACAAGESVRRREIDMVNAVRNGQLDVVTKALEDGLNPNALTEDSSASLLTEAVKCGQVDVVRALLEAGADANYAQPDTRRALHLAAGRGNVEMIQALLQGGADPMVQTGHGAYPIHDAIWSGRTKAAIALIPYYRSVNFNPDGKMNGYPVHMAMGRGNMPVVAAFIEAGMNVNDPMFKDKPLLISAVQSKREDMVQLLLDAGADVNARDAEGKRAKDYATGSILKLLQK